MALKNPQHEPVPPAQMPTAFDDDLAHRCFPHRFRRIGSPFAYLNDVGIAPILEYIYKGHLLIDVAEAVNVPLLVLREWVQHEGHLERIEEAETISAEGFLAEGMRRMRNAPTEFELRRAKEMVRHAQFMASKKNKPLYGESVKQADTGGGVTYVFNIPDAATAQRAVEKSMGQVIDSTSNRIHDEVEDVPDVPTLQVDLGSMFGMGLPPTPRSYHNDPAPAPAPEEAPPSTFLRKLEAPPIPRAGRTPEDAPIEGLRLVAARPTKPTPSAPDIGPFYEEVTP